MISPRRGRQLPWGRQHTILPKFPQKLKLKEFRPWGEGARIPRAPLDPPLVNDMEWWILPREFRRNKAGNQRFFSCSERPAVNSMESWILHKMFEIPTNTNGRELNFKNEEMEWMKFSHWFYNKIFRTKSMKNCKNQIEYVRPFVDKGVCLRIKIDASSFSHQILYSPLNTGHKSLVMLNTNFLCSFRRILNSSKQQDKSAKPICCWTDIVKISLNKIVTVRAQTQSHFLSPYWSNSPADTKYWKLTWSA